jgi:hypothetical protein
LPTCWKVDCWRTERRVCSQQNIALVYRGVGMNYICVILDKSGLSPRTWIVAESNAQNHRHAVGYRIGYGIGKSIGYSFGPVPNNPNSIHWSYVVLRVSSTKYFFLCVPGANITRAFLLTHAVATNELLVAARILRMLVRYDTDMQNAFDISRSVPSNGSIQEIIMTIYDNAA